MNETNNDLDTLVKAFKSLSEISEDMLDDETMKVVMDNFEQQFSPAVINQSINEIVTNLDKQGLTREEAIQAMEALKNTLNEMVYGEEQYTGNKKILIDTIMEKLYQVFNDATNKYHLFNIDLPMTLDKGAHAPSYAHDSDAAADLYALETVEIAGKSLGNKIRTGVKIQLPEGWLAMILPRSSMGTKTPLRLSNSVGLIDSGYRGELGVLYDNISDLPYTINAGDRIAQLLVMPSYRFQAKVVDTLEDSDRGETGFGDSGK